MRSAPLLAVLAVASVSVAGCIGDGTDEIDPAAELDLGQLADVVPVDVDELITFDVSVVTAAVAYTNDLYEPTIDVSDTGTIYIAGHTILVDTTGAPAFFSTDDGATWEQLPFLGPAQMPEPLPGATPPPSDEIFIVAGDDGWAYGVDITLLTFPVNAWSGDGSALAYHNPNGFDRVESTTNCNPDSLNDRPWAAYANGTLLMVNNPGGGPVQIGVLEVPPAMPLGVAAGPVAGPTWNTCASPGGWIPGIPDMRDDGTFMVPQVENDDERLVAVIGNKADIFTLDVVEVAPFTNSGSITSNYGHAVVDAEGQFFVGVVNNTREERACEAGLLGMGGGGTCFDPVDGQFKLAAYDELDGTFQYRTFTTDTVVRHLYLDGNMAGPGALVVWAVDGDDEEHFDWYTGHVQLGADGGPVLENVALAVDEGPRPSAHVTGAALGPDGRAYLAMYDPASGAERPGSLPLSVLVQQDGPTLPVLDAV